MLNNNVISSIEELLNTSQTLKDTAKKYRVENKMECRAFLFSADCSNKRILEAI